MPKELLQDQFLSCAAPVEERVNRKTKDRIDFILLRIRISDHSEIRTMSQTRFLKYSSVNFKPSDRSILGCHPRTFLALVISGWRTLGSS